MKSAYLYHFAQFVDWGPIEQATFNICTLQKVADSLSPEVLANKTVQGKKIKLAHFYAYADPTECHIVYLNASDTANTAKVAKQLSSVHLLTVGEGADGIGPGIINLSVKNDRLVFDVHLSRAHKANISLSSKLIALAQKVRD